MYQLPHRFLLLLVLAGILAVAVVLIIAGILAKARVLINASIQAVTHVLIIAGMLRCCWCPRYFWHPC